MICAIKINAGRCYALCSACHCDKHLTLVCHSHPHVVNHQANSHMLWNFEYGHDSLLTSYHPGLEAQSHRLYMGLAAGSWPHCSHLFPPAPKNMSGNCILSSSCQMCAKCVPNWPSQPTRQQHSKSKLFCVHCLSRLN